MPRGQPKKRGIIDDRIIREMFALPPSSEFPLNRPVDRGIKDLSQEPPVGTSRRRDLVQSPARSSKVI